ncbi:MAG: hypothetical protein ABFC38_13535 [Methanospirillum sp.]
MATRQRLETRGFGGEAAIPPLSRLAERLRERHGLEADLTTFRLLESLRPQVTAGIEAVAAGGAFYADRWREAIGGIRHGVLRESPFPEPDALVMDTRALVAEVRAPFAAMPAPSALGLVDRYFGHPAEAGAAIRDVCGSLIRAMRDAGAAGHVLIVSSPADEELEDLASPFTFFYCPDPDSGAIAVLLEHQRPLALPGKRVAELAGLIDQYGVRVVYLVDPTKEEVAAGLEVLDSDHLRIGGFCPGDCDVYWQRLAAL